MLKAHIRDGELRIPLSDEIRERAWERIFAIIDQVHPTEEQAAKPIAQIEEEIVEYLKETRCARRAHGQGA